MDRYVNYIIIPHIKLVAEYYYGDVLADDIIAMKKRMLQDENYNSDFNTIVFLQDLEVKRLDSSLIESQMSKYIQYVSSNKNILGSRKTAILTNTPDQVAIGTIYQDDAKIFPIEFKIVSTIEATFEWVELSMEHQDEMLNVLKQFRNERT